MVGLILKYLNPVHVDDIYCTQLKFSYVALPTFWNNLVSRNNIVLGVA
jgi:hypothetical protein